MAQRTSTLPAAQSSSNAASWLSFKRLWRTDAALNVISGDLIALFASPVGEWMGMNDDGILLLRIVGALTALYGLWQLWSARSGQISKTVYRMGIADMLVFAVVMFGAVILGLEFNDTGTAVTIGTGILFIVAADLWYFASRKA